MIAYIWVDFPFKKPLVCIFPPGDEEDVAVYNLFMF